MRIVRHSNPERCCTELCVCHETDGGTNRKAVEPQDESKTCRPKKRKADIGPPIGPGDVSLVSRLLVLMIIALMENTEGEWISCATPLA